MARIIFPKGKQGDWINSILLKEGISINALARICDVSERTVRDWRREKFTISKKVVLKLCNYFNLEFPSETVESIDYWYVTKGARKGALKRQELYGPLGTSDGRRKGGVNSQRKRRENPEKYKLLGCIIRKEFKLKAKYSTNFAEAVGIILGDGGISNYQVTITVSSIVDREYAKFICSLFEETFGERPTWTEHRGENTICLRISGIGLVEELENFGLLRGDKVRNQVDFPKWIWQNLEFQKACVRGLMDTDGGCFFHKHTTRGIRYKNFGMCFTSMSLPIG
ncbi:MAG: helix-turn-helix domain-containing protein, partial [Patescibacteria group bacterium]|nr:helix-turn-helix domain-containing protein [Patescibacteria group bacterium]